MKGDRTKKGSIHVTEKSELIRRNANKKISMSDRNNKEGHKSIYYRNATTCLLQDLFYVRHYLLSVLPTGYFCPECTLGKQDKKTGCTLLFVRRHDK